MAGYSFSEWTEPAMTPWLASKRLGIVQVLADADVPHVVWGAEAMACHSVPSLPRDPLQILVDPLDLEDAAYELEVNPSTKFRHIEPFDSVDDYYFPGPISQLVRRNLKKCVYLQCCITRKYFQPKQILLIPSSIFNFKLRECDTALTRSKSTTCHPERSHPAPLTEPPSQVFSLPVRLNGIRIPTFHAYLDSLIRTYIGMSQEDESARKEIYDDIMFLITWRLRRDRTSEIYGTVDSLPLDIKQIRNGLSPEGIAFLDKRFVKKASVLNEAASSQRGISKSIAIFSDLFCCTQVNPESG